LNADDGIMNQVDFFSPESLDAMSTAELRVWTRALLGGQHPFQLRPDAVYPANLLAHAFVERPGDTRRVFQHVVTGFLQELVDGDDAEFDWRSDAGVELIRALPKMVFGAARDRTVNLLLRLVGEWRPRGDADEIDFRLVALGGLLDLFEEEEVRDSRVGWEFWAAQPVEGADRLAYITTVMDGMSRSSIDKALGWLAGQRWDEETRVALEYIAPSLLLTPGFEAALERHAGDLESEAVALLRAAVEIDARSLQPYTPVPALASAASAAAEQDPDWMLTLRREHERYMEEVIERRERVWEPNADMKTLMEQIYTMSFGRQVEQLMRGRS
jgi:hypothetical protein